MRQIISTLRLYSASAWYSYRALYAWQGLNNYFAGKIVFPIAQMLFFLFLGKLAGIQDPLYIVVGHIFLLPATNGIAGVSMTVSGEREFRTLPYLIASPASRAPLFLGRSLVHIIDAMISTIAALAIGIIFFQIDLSQSNPLLLIFCVILLTATSCGMGLVLGSLSLRSREAWTITSMVSILLYMLSGVNFPVSVLPKFLQAISYSLPLTRGIQAARMALAGANWSAIQSLVFGEFLIGLLYIAIGYAMFIWFEKLSLVDGQIETM